MTQLIESEFRFWQNFKASKRLGVRDGHSRDPHSHSTASDLTPGVLVYLLCFPPILGVTWMEIKGRKKALLIGILYRDFPSESQLPGAARDVEQLRDLLIGAFLATLSSPPVYLPIVTDCYQYVPENIVVMTDLEGVSPEMKPTKPNIVSVLLYQRVYVCADASVVEGAALAAGRCWGS